MDYQPIVHAVVRAYFFFFKILYDFLFDEANLMIKWMSLILYIEDIDYTTDLLGQMDRFVGAKLGLQEFCNYKY